MREPTIWWWRLQLQSRTNKRKILNTQGKWSGPTFKLQKTKNTRSSPSSLTKKSTSGCTRGVPITEQDSTDSDNPCNSIGSRVCNKGLNLTFAF